MSILQKNEPLQGEWENLNVADDESDELSMTLLERRKRLHELASEINQWEDESVKNNNLLNINKSKNVLITGTPPIAPPLDSLQLNSVNRQTSSSHLNHYCSPKFQIMSFSNNNINKSTMSSPLTNSNTNKENKSPFVKVPANTTPTSKISTTEIINAANRMLVKRESNNNLNKLGVHTVDNNTSTCQETATACSFKDIKKKFENLSNQSQQPPQVPLTPKSIIKKFEELSRDNTLNNNPLSVCMASRSNSNSTTNLSNSAPPQASVNNNRQSSFKTNGPLSNHSNKNSDSLTVVTDRITPKSIISKFEMLLAQNQNNNETPKLQQPELNTNQSCRKRQQQRKEFKTKSPSPSNSQCTVATTSLTIVSSMNVSPTFTDNLNDFGDDEEGGDASVYDDEDTSSKTENDAAIYEELNSNSMDINGKKDGTSLFEYTQTSEENSDDNDDTTTINTQTFETQETYSLSSDYTGSFMNQDEFTELNDDNDEEDYTYDDEMEGTECDNEETTTFDQTTSDTCSTLYCSSQIDDVAAGMPSNPQVEKQNVQSLREQEAIVLMESEPLFSIKEYRRQKRRNNGRRSSVMPRQSLSTNKEAIAKMAMSKAKATVNNTNQCHADDQVKKTKYLERIKELEELIKQEENVIHQTGIALERCLTDTHFTGSSEHIECNRLLLISCQKRQAYVTEINRQKQLILNLVHKKIDPQTSISTLSSIQSSDEANNDSNLPGGIDLTGLLIFSDLQLPIKESYINKLKSGDEKRVFYFLCLIRNGIQVLQTQVISVQELIATRETLITFPNRMAISNVDINFKVKIDVYTLEVLPKDVKTTKQNLASNATSKFFSPLKNHNLFHSSKSHGSSSSNNNGHHNQFGFNLNHHYNEQNNLGVVNGGAKTSNFIHVDTIEICNKDIYNNKFKLSISSSSIPLTGLLYVNVRCMPSKSIELKGFMTLFEDVNGLGTWDRRWCFLNNYNISYWKYPEDEYRNGPLGIINLTKCINEKVAILPRDLCARKYTIELSTCDNEASLTGDEFNNEKMKFKRYRLSADTKDQLNDWLTNINYALANLRLWNPKAVKPIKK